MAVRRDFDVDAFLQQPLVARVATNGPTIRPVWFIWEEGCLWWLTGTWSHLENHLQRDPRVSVVIDTYDLHTGEVKQLRMAGTAEVVPYDPDRARRKLRRYLGADEAAWDQERFALDADERDRGFLRLRPDRLEAVDLSFKPSLR